MASCAAAKKKKKKHDKKLTESSQPKSSFFSRHTTAHGVRLALISHQIESHLKRTQ
jgi:hypothetical protein